MASRVLITGATGFTGRYLAAKLADRGYEVHGTVHGETGEPVPGVSQLHPVDISNSGAVDRLICQLSPQKVAHLAAVAFVAHSDVSEMYRSNILGTRNILQALSSLRLSPEAVLVASSANVYGNARVGMLSENLPAVPVNDYGITKATTELLCSIYGPKLPLIVVRPFNYTGRGQSESFLVPKIVAHARRREPEIELGNLDVSRDFSDVRGVVDAYARLLEAPTAIGGTFNVCSGRPKSLSEIVELVCGLSGHDLKVRVDPALIRTNEVKSLWGSNAALEGAIGQLAMPRLEETIRWMLEE